MTNKTIIQIFTEIGDMLDYRGANKFRTRAYHQAAESIELLSEPVRTIYKKQGHDGLLAIPGIGADLADKIVELLDTGRLKAYERLKKTFPAIVLEMEKIPGVGPSTAKKLYRHFQPKSVENLAHSLEAITKNFTKKAAGGLGEKTVQNVLRGIDELKGNHGRIPLHIAESIAKSYVKVLEANPLITKVDVVGSLRRKRETVGDIDIVASAENPKLAVEAFIHAPRVTTVLAKGHKATVIDKTGLHIDLEMLPKADYGSLLQHFTGSKEHNIDFRTFVLTKGLSFSEHGFKVIDPKNPIAKQAIAKAKQEHRYDAVAQLIHCPEETQVYATVGLKWIPPEQRETGKLAAAGM